MDRADASLRLQINAFDGERVSRLPVDELSVSELRARAASHFYEASVEGHLQAVDLLDRALRMKADDPMSLAMRAEGLSVLHQVRYEEMDAATWPSKGCRAATTSSLRAESSGPSSSATPRAR